MKDMKTFAVLAITLLTITLFQACSKSLQNDMHVQRVLSLDASIDYNNTDYPAHMESALSNQISNSKAALGRVLFYDEILSKNSRISCSSCHLQAKAFSDGLASSQGFAMGQTPRNSMALSNLTMNEWSLFWDMRASGLEEQVIMPILNHLEMGNSNIEEVIARMSDLDYYPDLFTAAYGSAEITETKVALALREFLRALQSYESPFDQANPSVNNGWGSQNIPDFESPAQRAGFQLFGELGCASCHFGNNIGGFSSANIGLDEIYTDEGLASWTGDPSDVGVFKVPSLRNIALTAPYMHDGRFQTLEEVINHYSTGIKAHPNLDWRLVDLSQIDTDFNLSSLLELGMDPIEFLEEEDEDDLLEALLASQRLPEKFNLTEQQKFELLAFLNSLTDEEYIRDPRFSDPFVIVEQP